MRKRGGTPSRRDKHVTQAAISPPRVARGRFVGSQQSGLAGCKPPPLFMHGASSCSSQRQGHREPWGASPRPSAPTYLLWVNNECNSTSFPCLDVPWCRAFNQTTWTFAQKSLMLGFGKLTEANAGPLLA